MCWVVFEVTVGSSNFPRRFHPKVSKGLSGFNARVFPKRKTENVRLPGETQCFWLEDLFFWWKMARFKVDCQKTDPERENYNVGIS